MNIEEIVKFSLKNNVEVAKIIVIKQDDSRKLLLAPKPVIRQIIQQSVEEDGLGKLYIFDNLSTDWLKNDTINLPCKFSSGC